MTDNTHRRTRALVGNDIVPVRAAKNTVRTQSKSPKPEKQHRTVSDIIRPQPIRKKVSIPPAAKPPETKRIHSTEPVATFLPHPDEGTKPEKTSTASKFKPRRNVEDPFIVTLSFDLFVIVLLGYIGFISHAIVIALLLYVAAILFLNIAMKRLLISALICLILIPVMQLLSRSSLEKTYIYCFGYFLLAAAVKYAVGRYSLKSKQKTL